MYYILRLITCLGLNNDCGHTPRLLIIIYSRRGNLQARHKLGQRSSKLNFHLDFQKGSEITCQIFVNAYYVMKTAYNNVFSLLSGCFLNKFDINQLKLLENYCLLSGAVFIWFLLYSGSMYYRLVLAFIQFYFFLTNLP